MAKNEKTSKRVAKKASQLLRSRSTSNKVRSVAASALTQAPDKKRRRQRKRAVKRKLIRL